MACVPPLSHHSSQLTSESSKSIMEIEELGRGSVYPFQTAPPDSLSVQPVRRPHRPPRPLARPDAHHEGDEAVDREQVILHAPLVGPLLFAGVAELVHAREGRRRVWVGVEIADDRVSEHIHHAGGCFARQADTILEAFGKLDGNCRLDLTVSDQEADGLLGKYLSGGCDDDWPHGVGYFYLSVSSRHGFALTGA